MITDWKTEIAIAYYVQQCTEQLDYLGMWSYYLPRIPAGERELADAETRLQHPIDPSYRRFLAHANGWPCFYQSVSLFGTNDLVGCDLMNTAVEIMEAIDAAVWNELGIHQSDLLPIAVAAFDTDLFLMARPSSGFHGQVIWLAGTVVDQFQDFDEFFLAMIDYKRIGLRRFQDIAKEAEKRKLEP